MPGMQPTRHQRVAAWLSLACAGLLVLLTVGFVIRNPLALLLTLLGLGLIGGGGWWLVTQTQARRAIGGITAAVGTLLIGWVLLEVVSDAGWRIVVLIAAVLLTAAVLGGLRMAVAQELHVSADEVPPPTRPVLIANPKSGGGKVDRFDIKTKAEELGVEVVLLNPGDDLEQLAREAIARGADCLGMAGGDGSQALVASVAVEHGLPFVCISAGTRNHFAMDLGLDRDDPSTGLVAFTEGLERRIDYATVNDKLFVNNVSMGVYATIVQEQSYRDAKIATSRELLPQLLGTDTEPFDLQFTGADGDQVSGAFVILVSNNPYVLGPKLDVSQRRSMTTGTLGVFAVNARTGAEAAQLLARTTVGAMRRDPRVHDFTATRFEVTSRAGSAFAGIDGEALNLPTPLVFESRPGALRMRVPADSLHRLRKRMARTISLRDLVDVALGRPLRSKEQT